LIGLVSICDLIYANNRKGRSVGLIV